MSLFDNRADLTRLQGAASAFQHDNPHFNQLLDAASGLLYNTSSNQLTPSDRRGLSMIMSTVQNSIPNKAMGDPVADFTSMNRALISGALPVMSIAADGTRSVSNSYGTGNVSLTASAQIMRTFEDSMRTNTGSVDLGQTRGLSHNLRSDLLNHLVKERGVKAGEIRTYDLGEATNAEAVEKSIKQIRADGAEEGTIKNLEKVRNAMQFVQKKLNVSDLSTVKDADIAENLKGHFDESTIKMTLAQAKGKNTNFQTQTKQLNADLKEMYKDVADNVKELSHLFGTEDLDELKKYAKGAGISNFLDKSKAHEVRAQMRDIAITAEMTGRSPQEVAAERVSIATGMSAMYGGRAVTGDLINVVQNAGVTATLAKGENVFTRDESMAAATRSIANMQNVYGGAIVTTSLYKELEKRGGVTDEMRAEYESLKSDFDSAKSDKERRMISMRMEQWGRGYFGSEAVDSPEARAHAFAKYSGEFHKGYTDSIKKTNARRHINNVAEKHGLTEEGRETMVKVGETLMSTFGNNQQARDEFFKLISTDKSEDTAKAVDMLKQGGMTEEQAKQFIKDTNSVGKHKAASIWSPLLNNSRFMQQMSGSYDDGERRKLLVTKLLNDSGNMINSADDNAVTGFLSGLVGEGGITTENAAEATIAEALNTAKSGSTIEEKNKLYQQSLSQRGLEAINIGAADETGKFTIKDPAQKRAVMSKLGITDEQEFDKLLADAPTYIKKLEEAGYNVSTKNKDSINGGFIAYSRKDAETVMSDMTKSIGDQGEFAAARSVFGEDNVKISFEDGKYKTVVNREGEHVSLDKAREKATSGELKELADAGDKKAAEALSNKFKNVVDKESRSTRKATSAVARLSDSKEVVGTEQFKNALREDYGTSDTTILKTGSIDDWVRTGLAEQYLDNDGELKYRMLHTFKDDASGKFKAGEEITAEDIKELQAGEGDYKNFAKHLDAAHKLNSEVSGGSTFDTSTANRPVSFTQMQSALTLLQAIYNK